MKDKTYGEIFQKTADDCRKRLGLQPSAVTRQSNSNQRPAFAGTRKGTSTRPATGANQMFDPNAADLLGLR
jgi:hypothetical protein